MVKSMGNCHSNALRFEPYLAGERTEIEQRTATLTGLTLATTRADILRALLDGLAHAAPSDWLC